MKDCVGSADLSAVSTAYNTDRNGLLQDAINLNSGYATFPSGIYFNSAFTITSWVKAGSSLGTWCRLVDFSTGGTASEVYFTLSYGSSSKLGFGIYDSSGTIKASLSSSVASAQLSTAAWSFVSVTYDGYTLSFYVNGVLIDSSSSATYFIPESVTRTSNFLGKSNSPDGYSNSLVDQLAIYNRDLTATQIATLYAISYTPSGAN